MVLALVAETFVLNLNHWPFDSLNLWAFVFYIVPLAGRGTFWKNGLVWDNHDSVVKYNFNMLKRLETTGFKSFAKKTSLSFDTPVTAIVGPNGSGKSNVVEAIRFVLGEQSMKSLRGKGGSDLIWKGSKILPAGKSGRVSITFDNRDRKFAFSNQTGASADLSFDEVILAREVSTDGGSNYFINGSNVRLKDLTELLGSVNIGASGHHIISQGEADRLLSASPKDRRGMIEDALGLKVFQSRIKESERKLEKTAINMKEVSALRRELAPHLAFLSKQVEKIQQAEELRQQFSELFSEYSHKEASSIAFGESYLSAEEQSVRTELSEVEKTIAPDAVHQSDDKRAGLEQALRTAEGEAFKLSREREELSRSIGRIEGKLDALMAVKASAGPSAVPAVRVSSLCAELLVSIQEAETSEDLSGIRSTLASMRNKVNAFADTLSGEKSKEDQEGLKAEIEQERTALETKLREIDVQAREAQEKAGAVRGALSALERENREVERSSYTGLARKATLEGTLRELALRRESLVRRKAVLIDEASEAYALVGVVLPKDISPAETDTPEMSAERETLHRKLERIKIKLEDVGGASGAEVLKEYEDTKDRDAFLTRELADLETSIASLRELIAELRETIERTFKEGIEKINTQFNEFFKLMFNGGSAFLSIVVEHKRAREEEGEEEESLPFEHGIEINVSLPHKKVRELTMLSGGERSLVSIALLFAMSQVNPPPFLVLDETDAALDEANSRRYGDMLDLLSKHSKLIVVTHNRETMSRAQVLYGVTMGLDGASKLLSIRFEEAVQIAK